MDTIDKFYKNDKYLDLNHDKKNLRKKITKFIEKKRREINKIQYLKDKKINYDNVVEKLAMIQIEVESENNKINFIRSVFPDESITDASKDIGNFLNEIDMQEDLYKSLKKIKEREVLLPNECDQYLNKVILNKKRRGLDLTEEQRNHFKKFLVKTSRLWIDLNDSFINDNSHIKFDRVELDGLTEDFLSNLEMCNNQYIANQNLGHLTYILKYCRVISTRQKIYEYFNTRNHKSNKVIFEKILKLRNQYAKNFGYQNYVDYTNETLMPKNGDNIFAFLSNLVTNLQESSRKENEILLGFKRQECEERDTLFDEKINSFDFDYYQRIYKEKYFSFDENFIKQYFPIDHVTEIILEIYQTLLHLRFYKINGTKTWHKSVTVYSVHDEHSKKPLGYFYLDLFTRNGKSRKIFHAPFKSIGTTNTGDQLPCAVMVADFPEPENDNQTLLTHADIRTFFGRFSFVIHNIICKTRYYIFNAISVEKDFIRAIMYMFENFAWDEDVIRKLSSHYITKEKLSDDLITILSLSRKVNASIKFRFEIAISVFDYMLHVTSEANLFDLYNDCLKKYTSYPTTTGSNYYTESIHDYISLNGKYYSNLWSRVIACDMFVSRFKKEGILNQETGMSFRKNIIEPGSTKSAEELLEDFLGRNHTIEPFLEFYGLK